MTGNLKYKLFFFFIFFIQLNYGQFDTEEERIEHAYDLFEQKKFIEAEPHMLQVLSLKNNQENSYKYGVCALFTYADKSKAIRFLKHAVKNSQIDPRAYFYLGKAYHLNYLFKDALRQYEKFKQKAPDKLKKELAVDLHVKMCNNGIKLMQNLTELVVEDKIESSFDRFQYSYDLSTIGGNLIVTEEFQSKYDEKIGYRSLIYIPKGNKDVLFYSSYGKDGKNGLDIYRVRKLPNGDWSEPLRLPDHINTPHDDAYAFLHNDGSTFYFCSKGHSSMGGYDVFRCMYNLETNSFGPPLNMDYKINTPDDDIMYVVDSSNQNAFFSSARSSKGGFLDVYKVKVEVFPIQNVILAGTFTNEINNSDYKATIQIKDIITEQIIGIYNPNDQQKYTIILPKSGKYEFIVETPQSEKIHAGMVEIAPQKELKPLKQEILLVSNEGNEQLIIRNLFDETVENESEILAEVIKELSNPEINIDEFPDSLFIEDITLESDTLIENVDIGEVDLVQVSKEMAEEAQKEADDIKKKMNASYMIAEKKSNESEKASKQAEEILKNIDEIENPIEKQQQIDLANEYHKKSKELNEQAITSINLANSLKEQHVVREEEAKESKEIASSIEKAVNEDSHDEAVEELQKLQTKINNIIENEDLDITSPDDLKNKANNKSDKADDHLEQSKLMAEEKKFLEQRLEQAKIDKENAKARDKDDIQQQIDLLENEIKVNDELAKEELEKYEQLKNESEELVAEADMMEELEIVANEMSDTELSEEHKDLLEDKILSEEVSEKINENENLLSEIPNDSINESVNNNEIIAVENSELNDDATNNDSNNSIERNEDWVDLIQNDIDSLNNDIAMSNSESEREELKEKIGRLEALKDQKENEIDTQIEENKNQEVEEAYEEIKSSLANSENVSTDYNEDFNEPITYNNNSSNEKVSSMENDLQMLSVKKMELEGLEGEYENEEKEKKKDKKLEEIQNKRNEIYELEEKVSNDFTQLNDLEKESNENTFNELAENINDDKKTNKDLLSAQYYMEQADDQFKKAEQLKEQANSSSDKEDKANLLREAHQHELAAIDNQQDALVIMEDFTENNSITNNNDVDNTAEETVLEETTTETIEEETVLEETTTETIKEETVAEETTTETIAEETTTETIEEETVAEETTTETIEEETVAEETTTETIEEETVAEETSTETIEDETIAEETSTETIEDETIAEETSTETIEDETVAEETTTETIEDETIAEETTTETTVEETLSVEDNSSDVVINQVVEGIEFNADEDPETYEVSLNVEEEYSPEKENYSSASSKQILEENDEEFKEIELLEVEINALKNELIDAETTKETEKLQEKIKVIEEKKAKKEIELAVVVQQVNAKEVENAKEKLERLKEETSALVDDSYELKQGQEYESTGNELLNKANELRESANNEKDPIAKKELLNEAASTELAAVEKINKAKKLYSSAIVEQYSKDDEEIAALVKTDDDRISTEILDRSKQALAKANEYNNNAMLLRQEAENANKKQKGELLVEAERMEEKAIEEADIAKSLEEKGNKIKVQEDAIIENIEITQNLTQDDIEKVRTTEEYEDYYEKQQEIDELQNEVNEKDDQVESLENIAKQQENKAKSLRLQAQNTEDEDEKEKLERVAVKLEESSSENKQSADQIKEEINKLETIVKQKEMAQATVITNLDKETANDIKALAIADFDNSPKASAPKVDDVVSTNFKPPTKVEEDIFVVNEATVYTASNPIPVNPGYPEGLIFKVQVGAFRRPIPQDLFKGFAPISAEKVKDDITRYRVGYFKNMNSANESRNKIRSLGYRDAFVVAIYNGERIRISEARELIANNTQLAQNNQSVNSNNQTESNENVNTNNDNTVNNIDRTNSADNTNADNTSETNTNTNTATNVDNTLSETNSNTTFATIDPDIVTYADDFDESAAEVNPVEAIKGLFFSVQIGAFSKPLSENNPFNISPLVTHNVSNLYKYSTGIFNSVDEANIRKEEVQGLGLTDAFIVAYIDGQRITIARANELANKITEKTEPEPSGDNGITVLATNIGKEYYVDLGVFQDSVPNSVSNALLTMREYRIKPRDVENGRQYLSGVFTSAERANQAAQEFINLGIPNANVIEFNNGELFKGEPRAVNGLIYRVFLGTYYEELPEKLKDVFMRLDYLDIETVDDEEGTTYYAGKKDLYSYSEEVLKEFVNEGVSIAKIVAFKDGDEIDIESAKNLTGE